MPLLGLIAVDIDGTLLNSKQCISERTADALRTAEASGIEVVLSTGNSCAKAASVSRLMGFSSHLICSNGALIRTAGGVTIGRKVFDGAVANAVLSAAEQFASRGTLTFEQSAGVEFDRKASLAAIDLRPLYGAIKVEAPLQITFCGPQAQMQRAVRAITLMPGANQIVVSMTQFGNNCVVDVGPAGATKGIALAILCDHLGIPPGRVAAIGDNLNDCGMLEFAAYPFVVANAPQDMKGRGWPIVPSNDEDGVAHAVESVLAHI